MGTWLNGIAATVCTALFLVGVVFLIKDEWAESTENLGDSPGHGNIPMILWLVFIAAGWVFLSGIGGFSYQNPDFHNRNAILHDLINFRWPVVYNGDTLLVYYLAYWIPSAIVGKIAGWDAANIVLFLWTCAAVFLVFNLLLQTVKSFRLWPIVVFILFSGLDALGMFIKGKALHWGDHIEWWTGFIQYSSFTSQLFWVFNQAVPAWIATLLLILDRKKKTGIIAIYSLSVPYGPFPAIGLFPFMIYFLLKKIPNDTKIDPPVNLSLWGRFGRDHILPYLSFSNVITSCVVLLVFGSYFTMNRNMEPGCGIIFNGSIERVLDYAYFCIIEFGIVAAFIAMRFRRDRLFLLTAAVLFFVPFYKAGPCNDFCMRVSIPALVILSVYSVRYVQEQRKYKILGALFIFLLGVGAITPVFEIDRSVEHLIKGDELIADHPKTLSGATGILRYYLPQNTKDSFFYRFLAKRSK